MIGLATDAAVDELMRRAQDAGAEIVFEAGNQKWGYAGAFADPDGHMWQVSRADGVLTRIGDPKPARAAIAAPTVS